MSKIKSEKAINKNLFKRLFSFLKKNSQNVDYEEIFSTTENKLNTKNTNPLDVDENSINISCSDTNKNLKKESIENMHFEDKKKKINFQVVLDEALENYPEYTDRQNGKIIRNTLRKEIKFLKLQLAFLILFFILSLALNITMRIKPEILSLYIPLDFKFTYILGSSILFILSLAIGFNVIKIAFIHFFKFTFTPDTALILPMITTFCYCIAEIFFLKEKYFADVFVELFILDFIFIIFNILINKKRVLRNLRFVGASKQKYNIDTYLLNDVLNEVSSKKLTAAYQYKTDFLTDFISNSHEAGLSNIITSILIPCSMIFSILCGIIGFILTSNLMLCLAALNISSLICIPTSLSLIASLNVYSLCKYTLKNRAMVISEDGIRKLSKVKSIILNDSDLYPPDNVILRGIKTFNGQRIDEAILYSAAVICSLKAPISHVFDKIIMGKRTILTKASDVVYKDKKGIVGWVNGQRILVGNRELLKEYKIGPPSRDYEEKHKLKNCKLTYFAIGHDLVAMFIIDYIPSKSLYDALYSCIKNDVQLFIKTVDCNISQRKIADDFDIDEKNITFLSYDENQLIDDFYNKSVDQSQAFASSFGTAPSLLKTICACRCTENNIRLSVAIQFIQLIFSVILIVSLILCFGLSEVHSIELVIYILLWVIFTVIASKIKKLK